MSLVFLSIVLEQALAKTGSYCCNNTVHAVKYQIYQSVENFKDFKIDLYFVCQPAIRLTSDRHMDPVFSHKEGDHRLNTDLLF